MSGGFQDIAAAIGIAELALRSISRIYEFVKYVKDAPESVTRLCVELGELDGCLAELRDLQVIGSPAQAVIRRLELSATVNRCGNTCADLEANLRRWTQGGRDKFASRLRVHFNKTQIENAIRSINSTKETIVLAISITSLHLQVNMATTRSLPRKPLPNQKYVEGLGSIDGSLTHHAKLVQHTMREETVVREMALGPTGAATRRQTSEASKENAGSGARVVTGTVSNEYIDAEPEVASPRDEKTGALEEEDLQNNKIEQSPDADIGSVEGLIATKLKKQVIRGNTVTGSANARIGGVRRR